MKKLLFILLTLFSLQSFAQDTVHVKVRGIPGAYNFSKSGDSLIFYVAGVRNALSVGSTVDLSNYYNKTQVDNSLNGKLAISDTAAMLSPYATELGKKRDTSYYQSLVAVNPLYFEVINPDSARWHIRLDTTSTLSDHSDTTVPSTKAAKNAIDKKQDTSIYKFSVLPFDASTASYYNANAFIQDNITTFNGNQYVVYITSDLIPIIAKRSLNGGAWQTTKLDSLFGLQRYDGGMPDGHGVYSIAIDKDGYIHIAGNMHNSGLKYFRSNDPESIVAFTSQLMVGTNETSISYPRFFKNAFDDLFFSYRQGISGNGDTYLDSYNTSTKSWSRVNQITKGVDGDTTFNFYCNRIVFDKNNRLHISGTWRATGSGNYNSDICYFYSDDNGVTFKNSSGTNYTLPITKSTSDPILATEDSVGIINQVGMDVDTLGRPHFVVTLNDTNGNTQLQQFYLSGTTWTQRVLTNYTSGTWLFGGQSDGLFSRPCIFSYDGNTFVVYSQRFDPATTKAGLQVIDITPEHSLKEFTLLTIDLAQYEMTFDASQLKKGVLSTLLTYVPLGMSNNESPTRPVVMDFDLNKISQIYNDTKLANEASASIGYVKPNISKNSYTKTESDIRYPIIGTTGAYMSKSIALDLNTVLGNSRVYTGADVINAPTAVAGVCESYGVDANIGIQMFQRISADGFYYRRRSGNVWSSWDQVASRSFVSLNYLSLSGGTITGNLTATTIKKLGGTSSQILAADGSTKSILSGSATLDFPSTATNATSDLTITVTGAASGDVVSIGVPSGSATIGTFFGFVSAPNTVTIRFLNNAATSTDPASGTFKVKVSQ